MSRRTTRSTKTAAAEFTPTATTTQAKAARPSTTIPAPAHLFEDADAWDAWLDTNHGTVTAGIWLKISKKGAPVPSVTYDQAVDAALCWGWIDGQRKTLDETHFLQRFTPRRKASIWSKRNVGKVAVLVEAGRMRRAGQAEVDAAKADGRWDKAYASASIVEVPADLAAALDRNKKARSFFDALGKSKRYSFLWRLETLKRQETRKARIDEFAALLAQGKTL
ncbi:bacteriocin-protection, YdeI or OmpD-associated-domain-containing protein [Lasiosphaeria miniovina]|uniref:Bacteriocin-protection, YdeI or OmpD-associated-domain-containing protein n=1 Tax=Lasiosphaeria miniovina TaxID=1954250 RepID=A0AA40DMH3_9PEZI|nr:bacteriocin-protection, YdeI or OmpD-associated-domain-containing protein [Lasiosphaeria miniovina]KAK0706237.1 bacteriocin-protection, YdeI or OmpD-associated-domain-containing protein [Lasiosphaeria miniovina]